MKISSWIITALTAIWALLVYPSAAIVFSDFDRFRRACPSTNVNVWKIKVGSVCYLTTPAHVAIYPDKDGKWTFSKFIDDFKDMDWRIRHQYTVAPSPQNGICWAKFNGDDSDALELEDSEVVNPTKVYVIFRQPYDMDAVWVSQGSEMGVTEAILYKTPRRYVPDTDDRPMLESMDVGFRGMSGGVAVNEKGKCVGIFVKRGRLIQLKPPRMATVNSTSAGSEDSAETVPASQPSWVEQLLFPSRAADIARTDAQLRPISDRLNHLADVVLKKEDLSELGVVFDARRGLFLPSTNILSIDDATSIPVKAVIGSKAPKLPRF